jgi:hypothetical protein
MGKERVAKKERHNPLHVQLLEDKIPGTKHTKPRRSQEKEKDDV